MITHRKTEAVALLRYLADEIEAGRCGLLKTAHTTHSGTRYDGPELGFGEAPDPKHVKPVIKGNLKLVYASAAKTPRTPDEEVEQALKVTL
jgi:hypothetical protein